MQRRDAFKPFGEYLQRTNLFLQRCRDFEYWLKEQRPHNRLMALARQMAITLVVNEVPSFKELHVVSDAQLEQWFPGERGWHARQILEPLVKWRRRHHEEQVALDNLIADRLARMTPAVCISAEELVGQLTPKFLNSIPDRLDQITMQAGFPHLFSGKPQAVFHRLEVMHRNHNGVMADLLHLRQLQIKLSTKSVGSMPAVRSAIKSWWSFATQIGYPNGKELPPREARDVVNFVSGFENGGTVSNYVGTLRWVSKTWGLSCAWDTEELAAMLKGVRKMGMQAVA